MIEIRVLGPVEADVDGTPVPLGGYQQQAVLAMLVAAGGQVVPVDRIVDQLWGDTPPPRPLASLQAYVSRLRRLLEPDRPPRAEARVLVSEGAGYALRLDPESVDAWRVEGILQRVQDLRPQGLSRAGAESALTLLRTAGAIWRGTPFEQFTDEPWARAAVARLAEARVVLEQRIVVCLLVLGRLGEAVPAARALAESEPLRGQAWRLWAVALWAAERSAEALDVLRRHRRHLAEELGLEPEPALAGLERAILEQCHERLATELRFGLPAEDQDPFPVRPAQLPRSPATFAAREPELAELARHADAPDGAPLVVISGVGGVGKTTLAVRWAHQVADRFPDGQLYADLRGYGPEDAPAAPGDVLLGFLGALGVPDHRIPPGVADRTALFRSVLAGRRMLLILDNARDAGQVRPLLPGAAGCAVVVTSRNRLGALLVSDGAPAVHLDGFQDEEARAYLANRLGAELTDAEPAARDAIVAHCGGLPLALAVVCARIAGRPGFTLATVAEELAEEGGLDAYLRAVFSWSYRQLPTPAAELFRHLALHPGPDVTLAAAVNVGGSRALLHELCDAHLLNERRPGRFAYHDLVRGYAVEQAGLQDSPAVRERVLARLVEHHLYSARNAARAYMSYPRPDRTGEMTPGIVPVEFTGREPALVWMDREYENVMALAEHCRTPALEHYLPWLAWTVLPYQQDIRFQVEDSFTLIEWALEVAERTGDRWWTGFLTYVTGRGHLWLNRYDAAGPYLDRAIAVGRAMDDPLRLAHGLLGKAVAILGMHEAPTREQAEAAYPYGREALENYRRVAHESARLEEAAALHPIGWWHFYQPGGRATAFALFAESVEIHLRWHNSMGAASSSMHLGRLHQAAGDIPAAVAAFEKALDLYGTTVGNQRIEPLIGLYLLHREAGDDAAAERARAEALGLLETARYPDLTRLQALLGA
ncbi:BTAD domain-containing putative transcriptional regulator [Actinoplanes sp. L3-i22]|uniref:AfsR/SARP family transcriptional regulator n=1 Tax=Actinoplanes sp. L3-i22 TaxID=2836373 RepID=UPI001C7656E4|nr:BTAD domain-containing putative transcriptional regulator [Actinoplanes sp. L3-i22]BCY12771.1 SARP family transcriptional regulator [Actinoplanes sp. L3-i22]